MKKIIEIRFVQRTLSNGKFYYNLQYLKNGLVKDVWRYVGYSHGAYDTSVWSEASDQDRDKLLQQALDHYFKIPRARVELWEHPTIIVS